MDSWEKFDEMVMQDVSSKEKELLKLRMSVLELQERLNTSSTLQERQNVLREEYNVEYSLEDIEDELIQEQFEKEQLKHFQG